MIQRNYIVKFSQLDRKVPTWQKPSTCKRKARGISLAYRMRKLLGL